MPRVIKAWVGGRESLAPVNSRGEDRAGEEAGN